MLIAPQSDSFLKEDTPLLTFANSKSSRLRVPFVVIILILSDTLAVCSCITLAVWLRFKLEWIPVELYLQLWPLVIVFPVAYAVLRLYPIVGISPVEELRRLTIGTTLSYLVLGATTFLVREGDVFARLVFLLAWCSSLIVLPISRAVVRALFARRSWWGAPCVIFGAGKTGQMIVRSLQRNPFLGLRPVAVLDDDVRTHGSMCGKLEVAPDDERVFLFRPPGVLVLGGLEKAPQLAKEYGINYAIIAMPGVPHSELLKLIEQHAHTFSHLIVIPDLFGFASLNVPAKDLGGVLGIQIRQQLLQFLPRFTKRALDLLITIPGVILLSPLLALIWILIRLESKGPAVFVQKRPGRFKRDFNIYKFRTMHVDAEARWNSLPQEMKNEFKKFGKIRHDPRITWIGAILRRTSFDELPQLFNVLKGEMSLVGPRAFLASQLDQIGERHAVLFNVVPGISGLWQVSGRSELTFEERLDLDVYYVRNWSVWLDIHIIARTFRVVLFGSGAY
jgi:Undecaprenyl-phosphate galactose phosphotransferase WbaP